MYLLYQSHYYTDHDRTAPGVPSCRYSKTGTLTKRSTGAVPSSVTHCSRVPQQLFHPRPRYHVARIPSSFESCRHDRQTKIASSVLRNLSTGRSSTNSPPCAPERDLWNIQCWLQCFRDLAFLRKNNLQTNFFPLFHY